MCLLHSRESIAQSASPVVLFYLAVRCDSKWCRQASRRRRCFARFLSAASKTQSKEAITLVLSFRLLDSVRVEREIESEEKSFSLWSSFLTRGTKRNITNIGNETGLLNECKIEGKTPKDGRTALQRAVHGRRRGH